MLDSVKQLLFLAFGKVKDGDESKKSSENKGKKHTHVPFESKTEKRKRLELNRAMQF